MIPWWKLFPVGSLCSAHLRNSELRSHSALTEWCPTCVCVCVVHAGRYAHTHTHTQQQGTVCAAGKRKLFSTELLISRQGPKLAHKSEAFEDRNDSPSKSSPLNTEIWREKNSPWWILQPFGCCEWNTFSSMCLCYSKKWVVTKLNQMRCVSGQRQSISKRLLQMTQHLLHFSKLLYK